MQWHGRTLKRCGSMQRVLVLAFLISSGGISVAATSPPSKAPLLAPQTLKAVPYTAVPNGARYDYTATFAGSVKMQGAVTASGIIWKCGGNQCRTSGPWPVPGVGACNALALQEGFIVDYGSLNRKLLPNDLASCNKGIPVIYKANKKESAPAVITTEWSPVSIRTAAFQVTGTAFEPVTIRTPNFAVTGVPVATSSFSPVTIRTSPFTVTGEVH